MVMQRMLKSFQDVNRKPWRLLKCLKKVKHEGSIALCTNGWHHELQHVVGLTHTSTYGKDLSNSNDEWNQLLAENEQYYKCDNFYWIGSYCKSCYEGELWEAQCKASGSCFNPKADYCDVCSTPKKHHLSRCFWIDDDANACYDPTREYCQECAENPDSARQNGASCFQGQRK